jgi:hypothetical protein
MALGGVIEGDCGRFYPLRKKKLKWKRQVNLSMRYFCFLLFLLPVNSHFEIRLARIRGAKKKLKLGKLKAEMENTAEIGGFISAFCFLLFTFCR